MRYRSLTYGILLISTLVITNCTSPYSNFYQPNPALANSTIPIIPFSGEPRIVSGSGNIQRDISNMYEDGYVVVGSSDFVGPAQAQSGAISQAKAVGAALIIISSKYRNTVTGAMPLTLPTATTSYSSGTVNGGFGSGSYTGTTTTYGTETTLIPYSVDKYEQVAVYFAPIERKGFGIQFRAGSAKLNRAISGISA